jgi:predicted MPP superfamily phosphohydrolase
LQPTELFRFGLFIAAVVLVYFLAAGILVRLALRRLGRVTVSSGKAAALFRRVILSLAALGTLCIAYGFVEPYLPQVTHVRVESPKLPAGSPPIRIIHISDIHSDPRPRLEKRLPEIIAAERPDLILFTGDAVNSSQGLPVFRDFMTRLARVAPTFAVRGNWDVWYSSDLDLFGGTSVRELNGEAVRIDVRGTPVWVAGVPADYGNLIPKALAAVPRGALSILLDHYPDDIEEAAKAGADLYLAGHTHGGQIALPWYGALITLSKFGKRFEAGLYRVGETWLYVNRGIGMEGGSMPRVRFCSRPEVTVIEVGAAD